MGKGTFIERRNTRNDVNQNYGLNRVNKEGTTQYTNTPPGRTVINTPTDKYLRTDGGKLHAPVGFDKKTIVIDGSNAIDIAQGGGNFVPRIVLDGTTSTTLDTIDNPLFEGQKIYIQAYSTGTITIGTAGNIQTGLTLTADHIIELIYDFDVGKWIMPEDNAGSGGSGEVFTWTADHTTGGFDLNNIAALNFDITGTNDGQIDAPTGVGIQYDVLSDTLQHKFFVNSSLHFWLENGKINLGGSTPIIEINLSNGIVDYNDNRIISLGRLDMTGRIDMNSQDIIAIDQLWFGTGSTGNGNYIKQDTAGNQEYVLGSSTDDHQFFCGSEFFRIDGGASHIECFVPLFVNTVTASVSSLNDTITLTSGSGLMYTGTNQHTWLVGGSTDLTLNGGGLNVDTHITALSDDSHDIGTSALSFQNIFLNRSVAIEDYYASGFAPGSVTGFGQLFIRDNGSGKSQLRVKFNSTTSQLIITET